LRGVDRPKTKTRNKKGGKRRKNALSKTEEKSGTRRAGKGTTERKANEERRARTGDNQRKKLFSTLTCREGEGWIRKKLGSLAWSGLTL